MAIDTGDSSALVASDTAVSASENGMWLLMQDMQDGHFKDTEPLSLVMGCVCWEGRQVAP